MKANALVPFAMVVAAGCAAHPVTSVAQAPITSGSMHVYPMTIDTDLDNTNPYLATATDSRKVGDWIATDFVSAGKHVTVRQRLLSRDGAMSVTEVAVVDHGRTQTFRLRSQTTASGEDILGVTKIVAGVEHATTMAAYDAALRKTVPDVERNDGTVDAEPVTVDVGGRKIDAVRTTYKVIVNGKPATMSVVHSDAFAWGDLGGDVITDSGKTLYSTHVVDMGGQTRAVADLK
jgi:hypothetical protein